MQRPSCANWVFRHLRHFVKDQRGSMSVLTISLLTAMFAVGGLALDATRLEHQRVKLQNTLDRCTLMAVTLRQKRDPEAVVRDCMDREGLEAAIKTVVPTTSANSRLLTVTASTKLSSLFPSLTGLGDLSYAAAASARYTMTKIEISLVLDVSGSMDGTRLADLKTSAKDFVSAIMDKDTDKNVSISLIPYNGQVNLGPNIRAFYQPSYPVSATPRPNYDCLDLPYAAYVPLVLPATAYQMTAYADLYSTFVYGVTDPGPEEYNIRCKPWSPVVLASQDIGVLHSAIDGMVAHGFTSINTGMRWGLTFLDPSSQSLFTSVLSAQNGGTMPTALVGRPFNFNDGNVIKVIVLMTDGENDVMETLQTSFYNGNSPIYRNIDGDYSIYHVARANPLRPAGTFYYTGTGPFKGTWGAAAFKRNPSDPAPVQLTWREVWETFRVSFVARAFYEDAFPGDNGMRALTQWNRFRRTDSVASTNVQLGLVCNNAKQNAIVIYGIAFEATSDGSTAIQSCASSTSHFFSVTSTDTPEGAKLSQAFATIATNIVQLNLTQ